MTSERGATFENTYEARGYPRSYGYQIDKLAEWFADKIAPWKHVEISKEQRSSGVDSVPDILRAIAEEAFREWGARRYELSYNQTCVAFFAAWDALQDSAP